MIQNILRLSLSRPWMMMVFGTADPRRGRRGLLRRGRDRQARGRPGLGHLVKRRQVGARPDPRRRRMHQLREGRLGKVVYEKTGKRGVDVVLDMVAGSYVAREIECLAEDGRLVIIAVQGGVKSEMHAGLVLRRRLTVTGSTLRARPVAFKAAIAQALREKVWPLLAGGRIRTVLHQVFPAAQAAQAHALMESNQHVGKIVLTWSTA